MKSQPDCGAIVLAAGASARLGEPKQLVRYRGESLLHHSVRCAAEADCRPVIVMLGFDAERMQREVADLDPVCIDNHEWRSGMASSVCAGISAMMQYTPAVGSAVLMVCDQPLINAALLKNLINQAALKGAPAAACTYAGVLGVPALFARRLWPQLLELSGDQGARQVLAACEGVVTLEFGEGAIDVDIPGDLIRLRD